MAKEREQVTIPAPNFQVAEFRIVGNAPYVQNKFSQRQRAEIRATHEAGSTAKKGKKREPKDFDECYQNALHLAEEGWFGIPASSFRSAMIDACRMVGFHMTKGKQAIFILPDGLDADPDDRVPLVKITKGKPRKIESIVRNETGVVDLRARPMWEPGWEANVRVRFDADVFTLQDVTHLLMRAGLQVGVGEGRPFSKKSHGCGWGTFEFPEEK